MTPVTASQTFAPTPVSQTFGKYLLFERIGAGGMAEVFRAVVLGPENFQRTLVIKRILPHLCQDPAFVQMFIDEAKVSGLLSHPNLVQIFEFGQIEASFFIAMEYVQGRTLAATAKLAREDGGEMPVAAATEIARQLCTGLEYAHTLRSADGKSLGIVHRDITPSNLMLSFHGAVKILDFGIARVADGLRQTQTQAGSLKGKISYMSPEQIQIQPVDHRSDLFSLGIVFYELLTGTRLFRADTDIRAGRMVLELEIPPPSFHNPALSPALDRIVMQALARNVEHRYQSAGAMAADLEQVMHDERMSPREHTKLLHQLFPQEAMAAADAGIVVLPSSGARRELQGRPTPRKSMDAQQVFASMSAADGPAGSQTPPSFGSAISETGSETVGTTPARTPWRKRLVLGVLALAAAAAIAIVAGRPRETRAVMAPAPQPPTAAPAGSTQETPPIRVRCSLDSTPQDAEVIRVDSGALMGRTPLAIALPQSPNAVEFRFDKPGYRSMVYRIIPDLDKSIRVDLVPTPAAAEPLASAAPAERSAQRGKSPSPHPRHGSRRSSASARSQKGSQDPSKQVRSATPVNPFDM